MNMQNEWINKNKTEYSKSNSCQFFGIFFFTSLHSFERDSQVSAAKFRPCVQTEIRAENYSAAGVVSKQKLKLN